MNPSLKMLEWLIDGHGDITIGAIGSIPCAASACDEDSMLAALVRREGETLLQLLSRLDAAVTAAYDEQIYIDEINE